MKIKTFPFSLVSKEILRTTGSACPVLCAPNPISESCHGNPGSSETMVLQGASRDNSVTATVCFCFCFVLFFNFECFLKNQI